MKAVIVLLALVAVVVCQPAICGVDFAGFQNQTASDDPSWSEGIALPASLTQCFQVNATNPDSTVNNTIVIAARIDGDSASENTTTLTVWNNANPSVPFQVVNVTSEDDVDSICVNLNSSSSAVQTGGWIYYSITTQGPNVTVDTWVQITDSPSCGPDADLSGGGSFWIWIIVAVVIVVIIAVIIAGAGAFVYYQKKKKGQAKLYEDS